MLLSEGKETIGTSGLDAEPDMVLEMPTDSFAPISLTVGMAILFVGLLLKLWVAAIVGGVICGLALIAWFWPLRELREREAAHG
jgi:hypothetical protein